MAAPDHAAALEQPRTDRTETQSAQRGRKLRPLNARSDVDTPNANDRSQNDRARAGGPRRRHFTWLTSFRCTECDRILLSLWRELPQGRWRATEPTPCKHVTAEQIEVYRFTKRDERDELELPIRAGRGRLRGKATRSPAAKQEAPNRAA